MDFKSLGILTGKDFLIAFITAFLSIVGALDTLIFDTFPKLSILNVTLTLPSIPILLALLGYSY